MGRILNTLAIVLAAAAGWGVHELYSPNKAPELQKPAQKAVAAAPEVNQTADKPDLESRISDTNVMAITNTGEALFNDGKYKEAAEQYKKASDAFPKDADMMYNYAISRVLNNPLDKET
ncbi:MAG: hypothetical protein KKA79_00590, partial [Nanoarchaeota archaeon]|nr:hypothetical protein [Nanoarchaeota archaeon]